MYLLNYFRNRVAHPILINTSLMYYGVNIIANILSLYPMAWHMMWWIHNPTISLLMLPQVIIHNEK